MQRCAQVLCMQICNLEMHGAKAVAVTVQYFLYQSDIHALSDSQCMAPYAPMHCTVWVNIHRIEPAIPAGYIHKRQALQRCAVTPEL